MAIDSLWAVREREMLFYLVETEETQAEEGSYDWFVAGSSRPATPAPPRQFNISSGKYLRKVHLHRIKYYLSYKA